MFGKLVNNKLISKSLNLQTLRNSHTKQRKERLPAFVRYTKPNIPEKNESSIYSEEEKIQLWKSACPGELRPTYTYFNKEERQMLSTEILDDKIKIPDIKYEKNKTAFANEEPYNEVFADGVDNGNFTKAFNLVEKNPDSWFWVERLMPINKLPVKEVRVENEIYPSGFIAPKAEKPDLPYFVTRTRNNLLPVYKVVEFADQKARTVIRKIDGDIWLLEMDLRTELEAIHKDRILSSINESNGELKFLGSFVDEVAKILLEKGF